MRYQEPEPISRDEALAKLRSTDSFDVSEALIDLAFHETERSWVEEQALQLADHPDWRVRATVALTFGHLARIHGTLDFDAVIPVLRELRRDPELAGRVQDAFDDIKGFTDWKSE